MELQQAIRQRRSIGKVLDLPVEKEKIERILESAVWAPNHHHTEPWKFFVMTGEGRRVLGSAYANAALDGLGDLDEEEKEKRLSREEAKAMRAPVVIAVGCSPSTNPRVIRSEELAAVHCAVQNILLTAYEEGLGAVWRSGEPMQHPSMKSAFGLKEGEDLVGFIYIGYTGMIAPEGKRIAAKDKTFWIS
ncbi:nitroreductase family protein [Paenibacillus herberti]|uniref:Putative NAD(P)H nitroreductase n=1 Tax=Paenibacillus herberti TaxID=1619309 RepID=A0A229NVZ7_9BACL|nr:nitroreductase [Paenibacillus herberti]OXM13974.1 nitroreductase [Paenibacillus herberti]